MKMKKLMVISLMLMVFSAGILPAVWADESSCVPIPTPPCKGCVVGGGVDGWDGFLSYSECTSMWGSATCPQGRSLRWGNKGFAVSCPSGSSRRVSGSQVIGQDGGGQGGPRDVYGSIVFCITE